MIKFNILLDSVDKVKSFVGAASSTVYDMDIVTGRYVIDAKSIMGIFSLNLSKPLSLHIHADSSNQKAMEEKFKEYLA